MTTPTTKAVELPEALRVPLDSIHADAGYLCGRLLNGSLTQEQVVASIRRRIDAAKLAAQALSAAQAGVPSDAMVDAYLQAQRRAVEEADQFGRPNIGGLHTNTVREACRAGLKAALTAAPQPSPSPAPQRDFSDVLEIQRLEAESNPADAYMVGLYNGMSMMVANYKEDTNWEPMKTQAPSPAPAQPAHVQNPAEIEHVAGDVSKNGVKLNMSTAQPAPDYEAGWKDGYKHGAWSTQQPATACRQRPIAYVDGDDVVRRILWEPNQAAFDIAVGTKLYAYQSPADAVDAERYRWLRRWKGQEHEPPFTVQHEIDGTLWGGDLDAAIDAAMNKGGA